MAPPRRWHLERIELNGQVAFANYGWTEESHSFVPHGVTLLTLRGSKIAEVIAYRPNLVHSAWTARYSRASTKRSV